MTAAPTRWSGWSGWRSVRPFILGATASGAMTCLGSPRLTLAQVTATMSGAPVQVQPYVPEPGVPSFTVPTGSPTPPPDTGSGTGTGIGTASNVGGSDPLNTMLATSWGGAAVSNAEALGVNPSALAATCVLESGCQNVGGSGSITGAFQMTSATYTAMINQALADDPGLASSIVPGLAGQSDPATQSIAASEYLSQAAQALQSAGVSNPTVLQARGYYNFGPSGAALALADDSELMSQAMPNVSQTTFSNNGVTPGETVGQWKSAVSAKIGTAANQSVIM
jgi:type II secretory pathway pseudopilin PulG